MESYLLWQYFLVFWWSFNRQNHGSVDIDINISKWYVNFHELSINTRALNISKYVFVASGKTQHARGSPSKPSNIQSVDIKIQKSTKCTIFTTIFVVKNSFLKIASDRAGILTKLLVKKPFLR